MQERLGLLALAADRRGAPVDNNAPKGTPTQKLGSGFCSHLLEVVFRCPKWHCCVDVLVVLALGFRERRKLRPRAACTAGLTASPDPQRAMLELFSVFVESAFSHSRNDCLSRAVCRVADGMSWL